jgi:hypothetical protein
MLKGSSIRFIMKITVFIALLLLHLPLAAQFQSRGAYAPEGVTAVAVSGRTAKQLAEYEVELSQLMGMYRNADARGKTELQQQVYQVLMWMLDLRLEEKERELNTLEAEVQRASAMTASPENTRLISQLQQQLEEVKRVVAYRRHNKDKIVRDRMADLLN